MFDERLARLRAHRNNIHRYRRLLDTILTDHERRYIEDRLAGEWAAMEVITGETFPFGFALPPTDADRGAGRNQAAPRQQPTR